LWGEGAIPQWLMYLWFLRAIDPTIRPDMVLANLLQSLITHNTARGTETLVGPYFTAEDVVGHQLRYILGDDEDPLQDWSPAPSSYAPEGLFHLLVRTGLKRHCQKLWPGYSRLGLRWFEPAEPWQYCLWRSLDGVERERRSPLTQTWAHVTSEARDVRGQGIPRI
jgi:hypothetical protein